MDSVHRILQARILEWVAMPSSRGSSWPRDQEDFLCLLYLLHWQEGSLLLVSPGKPRPCIVGNNFIYVCMHAQSCLTLDDPMGYIAHQALLSTEFYRQEYWSGLPFPTLLTYFKLLKTVMVKLSFIYHFIISFSLHRCCKHMTCFCIKFILAMCFITMWKLKNCRKKTRAHYF